MPQNKKKTDYALSLEGEQNITTSFNITKKINDFDLKFNFDYDLKNEMPDRTIGIMLSKTL